MQLDSEKEYEYLPPTQPPIRPPYQQACHLRKNNLLAKEDSPSAVLDGALSTMNLGSEQETDPSTPWTCWTLFIISKTFYSNWIYGFLQDISFIWFFFFSFRWILFSALNIDVDIVDFNDISAFMYFRNKHFISECFCVFLHTWSGLVYTVLWKKCFCLCISHTKLFQKLKDKTKATGVNTDHNRCHCKFLVVLVVFVYISY